MYDNILLTTKIYYIILHNYSSILNPVKSCVIIALDDIILSHTYFNTILLYDDLLWAKDRDRWTW